MSRLVSSHYYSCKYTCRYLFVNRVMLNVFADIEALITAVAWWKQVHLQDVSSSVAYNEVSI